MKKLRYILFGLFFFVFMIDVKAFSFSDYQELYKNGNSKTCSYYSPDPEIAMFGINEFTFTFKADGLYLKTNDFSDTVIFNDGRASKSGIYLTNSSYLNFKFSEDYLNAYKNNNYKCPAQVSLLNQSGAPYVLPYAADVTFDALIFNTKVTNIDGKECHYNSATSCIKATYTLPNNQTFYLEFGYYGTDDIYFGVSDTSNWSQTRFAIGKLSGADFSVGSQKGYTFRVESPAVNEIWLGNGKFIAETDLVIKTSSVANTIYVSGSEATNAGDDLYGDGTVNKAPDVAELPKEDLPKLPITETLTFCEQEGVLKTFQVLGYILFVLKLLVPLILIIMGSVDFAKAIISSNEKPNAAVLKSFVTRVIIGVIIFLIPSILGFLISLVDGASETFEDGGFSKCTDCLLYPLDEDKCHPKIL